jgi:hypothetical protein
MTLGLSLEAFTRLHVALSLVGIVSGLIVLFGLIARRRLAGWTALFVVTTILTSVTGFGFPFDHLLPSHEIGIVSLVVLAITVVARYALGMVGAWRVIYVIGAALALYLNGFVGVVQAFLKIPALTRLAPNQTEAPFVIAQLAVLALVMVLTVVAARRFRA